MHVSSLQCKELGADIAFLCPSSAIKCRIMPSSTPRRLQDAIAVQAGMQAESRDRQGCRRTAADACGRLHEGRMTSSIPGMRAE